MAFLGIATDGVVISPSGSISIALACIEHTLVKVLMAAMHEGRTR